jgi:hypothetical protein
VSVNSQWPRVDPLRVKMVLGRDEVWFEDYAFKEKGLSHENEMRGLVG